MPLTRQGATPEADARRLKRNLDSIIRLAATSQLHRTGCLQTVSDLLVAEGLLQQLSDSSSNHGIMPFSLWTGEQSVVTLLTFGVVASRWAGTGGGVVQEERSAASVTGTADIASAWVSVLSSFGKLLRMLHEALKLEGTLQPAANKVLSTAIAVQLIPSLGRLLASPTCAPAAGIIGLRTRAAAHSTTASLCALAFHTPMALLPPPLARVRACTRPSDPAFMTGASLAGKPVGLMVLLAAAPCALFEHFCRATCIGVGGAGEGAGGGVAGGTNRSGVAAITLQMHSVAAEVITYLGRALLLLRLNAFGDEDEDEEGDGNEEEEEEAPNRVGRGPYVRDAMPRWLHRAFRRSVRQILSGTCLQYFLAAHVACQLHAADGGGLYGMPEGAELQELEGCSLVCACSGQVRSGGLLGTVRCWLQAQEFRYSRERVTNLLYTRHNIYTMCMRIARVCLASYRQDQEAAGNGSGSGSGSGASCTEKAARGSAAGRGRGDGRSTDGPATGNLAVQGTRQPPPPPWERLRLRALLAGPTGLVLEALLAAAAVLPRPPIRCHGGGDSDDDGGDSESEEDEEEDEDGKTVAKLRRLKRRWWAVAVPALHAVLDELEGNPRAEVSSVMLQRMLHVSKLPSLEADLPREPPECLDLALRAGYLPCMERSFRVIQRHWGDRRRACILLGCVNSWRRTARLLAYGDVRQAAALVATVGKLLLRVTQRTEEDDGDVDATGEPREVLVPLSMMPNMLAWLAWREVLLERAAGAGGSGGGKQCRGQGNGTSEAAGKEPEHTWRSRVGAVPGGTGGAAGHLPVSMRSQQLLRLVSFAVARWLPHVAAISLSYDGVLAASAVRAGRITLAWVPPLVHAYARAVDAGHAAAAAAWRALLLYDMDLPAVLLRYMRALYDKHCWEDGQGPQHGCAAGACGPQGQGQEPGGPQGQDRWHSTSASTCSDNSSDWETASEGEEVLLQQVGQGSGGRPPLGGCDSEQLAGWREWHTVGEGQRGGVETGVVLVRRGLVRGGGEGGAVEEFRTECVDCCQCITIALWAVHCFAAAFPEDMAPRLRCPAGQQLVRYVRGVVGPQGVAPRPRLLQLLEKLAEGGGSSSGGGSGSKVSGAGPGVGGLATVVPDPAVCEGAWSSEVAAQLVPPHSVCAALGVRLCGNPRCEVLSGGSELAVPLGGACTRCRAVWYCGRGCQAAHWRVGGHKEVCAAAGTGGGAG